MRPAADAPAPLAADEIAISVAMDDFVAMPTAALLASIVARLAPDRRLRAFVVHSRLSRRNRERLLRSVSGERCRIELVPFDIAALRGAHLAPSAGYPAATYAKLLVPHVVPDHVHKIIQLDTDMVVMRDLAALWDEPIDGIVLRAAPDPLPPTLGAMPWIDCDVLQVDPDTRGLNGGVMVINCDVWRSEGVTSRALDFILRRPQMVHFADQDVLSVILAGQWTEIDLRWNQIAQIHDLAPGDHLYDEATTDLLVADPWIIHYTGPKPWRRGCPHPHADLFFAAVDQTAWAGCRPTAFADNVSGLRRMGRQIARRARRRIRTSRMLGRGVSSPGPA